MGEGFLDITVTDNHSSGIVITLTNSGSYQPSEKNGIGLAHVSKRLEELYAGAALFDILQVQNQVVVQLKLPVA